MTHAFEPPADLTDAALAARIAYLHGVTEDAEFGEDNLTATGWLELDALELERDRRLIGKLAQ